MSCFTFLLLILISSDCQAQVKCLHMALHWINAKGQVQKGNKISEMGPKHEYVFGLEARGCGQGHGGRGEKPSAQYNWMVVSPTTRQRAWPPRQHLPTQEPSKSPDVTSAKPTDSEWQLSVSKHMPVLPSKVLQRQGRKKVTDILSEIYFAV